MKKPNQSIYIVLRVIPYLWPKNNSNFRFRVIISVTGLFISKLIAVITPFFFKEAIDNLITPNASPTSLLITGSVGFTLCYGVARILRVIFQEFRDMVFSHVGQRAIKLLALETISHIHKLSMRYHVGRKTGALSRIIERGVKGIDFLLRYLLFNIGPLIIELIMMSIIIMWLFGLQYFIVIFCIISLYIMVTTYITEWRVKIRQEMNDRDKDANQKAIDGLLNFETVKYFGAEELEVARYDESMKDYEKASILTLKTLSFLNSVQAIIINSGMIIVMVLVIKDIQNGVLTIGDFVMINTYMLQLMMPLDFLGSVYREIKQSIIDMSEMFTLLEQKPDVEDRVSARELKIKHGEIIFKNISFAYDKARQIIDDFSLTMNPGSIVAIVGASGSGKSTIGRLLFRFYDVDSGSISIDGQDIRDVTQKSLHSKIGVIPQDTVLFNDPIYYNIAYGRANATEKEVKEAAKLANIHDFIESLPEGYNTIVGERGLKLSGGERQRVGIARTMLKNPPILLLDEATSSLDTKTERDIQDSFTRITHGKTILVIAHRLSTIINADKIIVLQKGKIIEEGSHNELLKQKGSYASMWAKQLKEPGEEMR